MRVCILGSGLSALTLAKALTNENIYVDIFSKSGNRKISPSRTIGISKSNFDYFNKNISNIENISWKIKRIEIFTDNLKNEKILKFDNKDQLFSIVKNYKLYENLNKSLLKTKYFKKKIFTKKKIDLSKYNIVINTDYLSVLTKKYFNKKILKTYNSNAYTTVFKHKKIDNDAAVQIFTKNGPLAFLPISKNETSIVYSINNSKNNFRGNINDLIHKYNFKYKIEKIKQFETFELKSFFLRSYYNKNILAFGDLLHRVHPLAGQGFNMTIRDLKIFIQIIKEKINLGLSLDRSVNEEFEKKIRHKNYIFSTGIDLIHEFFNLERKLNNNILSKSLKIIAHNPAINKTFKRIADTGELF